MPETLFDNKKPSYIDESGAYGALIRLLMNVCSDITGFHEKAPFGVLGFFRIIPKGCPSLYIFTEVLGRPSAATKQENNFRMI